MPVAVVRNTRKTSQFVNENLPSRREKSDEHKDQSESEMSRILTGNDSYSPQDGNAIGNGEISRSPPLRVSRLPFWGGLLDQVKDRK